MQKLIHAAREDKEEWVSITAKALGDFAVPLDFAAMLSGSAIVSSYTCPATVHVLWAQVHSVELSGWISRS